MSLVNINSVHRQVLQKLEKLDPPAGIELLSYKRNRAIAVTVISQGNFQIIERGYVEQELFVTRKELHRALKTMIRKEFPRSRKVRICKYAHPEELERPRIKI